MQPDLPWNVAGIPPEAREAARAAARREGLSVGEWLTRRILRSLSDGNEQATWPRNATPEYRLPPEEPPSSSRDTEDMLARVSRTESESSSAYRRIEDQLRNLARRLEAAERTQSENSRAVNQAATEISIATREQSQAFDQLGSHVVGLGDRLARVERSAADVGVKDAVKGLHAGLSRLADQISETTTKSAQQIATLANNVESVAGRIGEARNEAENATRGLSSRVMAFEDRVRAAEATLQAVSQKLDSAVTGMSATGQQDDADKERQTQLIAQLSDSLEKLSNRITNSEAQTAGAMARLEDQVAAVQSRQNDAPADRRLQSIETALTDIAGRLENSERSASGVARTVEENLRNFSIRLDGSEKRQRDAIAELQAAPSPPAPPPPAQAAPASDFDLPPFPDGPGFASQPFAADIPFATEPPPFQGAQPGFAADAPFAPEPFSATETAESYIAAARRSARAAAAPGAQAGAAGALGGFSWGAAPPAQAAPAKTQKTRFSLVFGIVALSIAAVAAGIFLSRGLVHHEPAATDSQVPHLHGPGTATLSPPVQDATPDTAPATASPDANTAPGSPVIQHPIHKVPDGTAQKSAALSPSAAPVAQTPARTVSSLERLTNLATAGSSKAQLLLGLKYLDGDGTPVNEAEAAKWLERAANQGEAIAACRLGTLYARGHGVPADPAKAAQWFTAAAKLGNRKAMHDLAVAYAEGTGVTKDLNIAAQWFSKAASLGLADSQFNLAVLYERGMGVQQSLIDAYKWYAIAAAQGDAESKLRLDAIATQLSPDERAAAQKAASEFHPLPLDRNANVPPDPSMVG